MDGSPLQRLKLMLQSALPLPAEVFLIYAGLGCYLLTCLLLGRPLTWAWALLPGLLLALLLEGAEILDYYGLSGLAGLATPDMIAMLGRHMKDVILVNLAPLLILLAATYLRPPPAG